LGVSSKRRDDQQGEPTEKQKTAKPLKTARQRVKKKIRQSSSSLIRSTTFQTALVIVPPDNAWDNIQRARHFARDESYNQWPPCIRLFHPFCLVDSISDVALDLALIVEDAELEPFDVRLSQWTIIPHAEALEADVRALDMAHEGTFQDPSLAQTMMEMEEDHKRATIEALISSEEQLGKQNKIKREISVQRKRQRMGVEATAISSMNNTSVTTSDQPPEGSPREVLEKQRDLFEEFNGPCVLCLEPDKQSQEKLKHLREFLQPLLFDTPDYYSPTSSFSNDSLKNKEDEASAPTFRPVIPIASFSSVANALDVARKLKSLFGAPVSFPVTNLQIISCSQKESVLRSENEERSLFKTSWLSHSQDNEQALENIEQFGCDAMVRLVGEEISFEDEQFEAMVQMMEEDGEDGGGADGLASTSDDESEVLTSEIEQWLDEDDDFDEGTVVVIGRTHLYTGENRLYGGMPATSMTDAKDRLLGDRVTGASRRKHAIHQSKRIWAERDWGRPEEASSASPIKPIRKAQRPKDGLSDWTLVDDDEDVSD
jgi:hypothetical protein